MGRTAHSRRGCRGDGPGSRCSPSLAAHARGPIPPSLLITRGCGPRERGRAEHSGTEASGFSLPALSHDGLLPILGARVCNYGNISASFPEQQGVSKQRHFPGSTAVSDGAWPRCVPPRTGTSGDDMDSAGPALVTQPEESAVCLRSLLSVLPVCAPCLVLSFHKVALR